MARREKGSGRGKPSLARKVEALARRECLFPGGAMTLVMVSGGQDSTALLHLLSSGSLGSSGPSDLHALHVNYHLRGAESDDDESLVARMCDRLGVELTVTHRPIDKKPGNVQEVAREVRREAALETARKAGCERIALGHTADDQVETLLYRMGRYGGMAALVGMAPADPPWVRPLLGCRRVETAAYCEENDLEFASDRGNLDAGYARTGIRQSVVPAWEAELPGAVEAACRTAEVAAEVKQLTDMVVGEAAASARVAGKAGDRDGDESGMSSGALLSMSSAVRRLVLHEWLSRRATPAASRASVLAVESLLSVPGSASRSLVGGWRAVKEYDLVRLERGTDSPGVAPDPVELAVPGVAEWAGAAISAEMVDGFLAVDVAREAIIDADAVSGGLVVRGPEPGDSIRPLGAPGSRRLKEVLVDLKVPARERPRRPLVVCGERIVWVSGLVVAEEAKVTRNTDRFLRLSIEPVEGGEDSCGP